MVGSTGTILRRAGSRGGKRDLLSRLTESACAFVYFSDVGIAVGARVLAVLVTAVLAAAWSAAEARTALAAGRPSIAELRATNPTDNDATLEAVVEPNGAETKVDISLADPCPGPEECIRDVRVAEQSVAAASGAATVSVALDSVAKHLELTPNTTYYFSAMAESAYGVSEASSSFATAPDPAPLVLSEWVSDVTSESASLEAEVDPDGRETTYEFELSYAACQRPGPESAPCLAIVTDEQVGAPQTLPAGETPVRVSATAQRLHEGYEYAFRIVASSSGGQAAGEYEDFATAFAEVAPPPAPVTGPPGAPSPSPSTPEPSLLAAGGGSDPAHETIHHGRRVRTSSARRARAHRAARVKRRQRERPSLRRRRLRRSALSMLP